MNKISINFTKVKITKEQAERIMDRIDEILNKEGIAENSYLISTI